MQRLVSPKDKILFWFPTLGCLLAVTSSTLWQAKQVHWDVQTCFGIRLFTTEVSSKQSPWTIQDCCTTQTSTWHPVDDFFIRVDQGLKNGLTPTLCSPNPSIIGIRHNNYQNHTGLQKITTSWQIHIVEDKYWWTFVQNHTRMTRCGKEMTAQVICNPNIWNFGIYNFDRSLPQ